MNILSALAGLAGTSRPEPGQAAAEDPRAGLFAALLGRGAEAPEVEPEPDAGSERGTGALLAEMQATLDDPDLSDEELAETLASLVAALTGQGAGEAETAAPLEAETQLQSALQALQQVAVGVGLPQDRAPEGLEEGGTELRSELSRLVSGLIAREGEPARPMQSAPLVRGDLETGRVRAGAEAEATVDPREGPTQLRADARPDPRPDARSDPHPDQRAEVRPDARPALAAGDARLPIPPAGDPPAAPQAQALTPINAGSAPSPAAAPRPAPMPDSGQILNQLRAHVSDDGTIRVALRPEGLGRVEISLAPGEDGQINVTVRADQASVLGSLRADRDGLVTLLREAGHQIDPRGLSFGDLGDQPGGEGARQGPNHGSGGRPGAQSFTWSGSGRGLAPGEAAADPTETPHRADTPPGGVDITV